MSHQATAGRQTGANPRQTTAVARWEPTGIDAVDRAVATWRPASMVPMQFKDRQGNVKVEDLALAAHWLHTLDIEPLPNIPDVYVIKGRVGLMAALQRALAARAGYDLEVVGEPTAESATVRIRHMDACHPDRCPHWKPPVTVTMAQARQAGWAARSPSNPDQPSNYELIPDRMLTARACTKALDLYAPGVRRGIAAAAAPIADMDDDDVDDAPPEPTYDERRPPRSIAPNGSTIPEPLREPEVDESTRAQLIDRLADLDATNPLAYHPLFDRCKALGLPNVRSHRFTRAHGALLLRLIDEAVDEAETAPAGPRPQHPDGGPPQPPEPPAPGPAEAPQPHPDTPDAGEATPADVIDRQPEAAGYDDNDPSRPF